MISLTFYRTQFQSIDKLSPHLNLILYLSLSSPTIDKTIMIFLTFITHGSSPLVLADTVEGVYVVLALTVNARVGCTLIHVYKK